MNLPQPHNLRDLFDQISEEITKYGTNHAPIPIAISYEAHLWHVMIDVRMTKTRTFDFEMTNPDLTLAVRKALSQLRREIR
jgi:hypothetical protein